MGKGKKMFKKLLALFMCLLAVTSAQAAAFDALDSLGPILSAGVTALLALGGGVIAYVVARQMIPVLRGIITKVLR